MKISDQFLNRTVFVFPQSCSLTVEQRIPRVETYGLTAECDLGKVEIVRNVITRIKASEEQEDLCAIEINTADCTLGVKLSFPCISNNYHQNVHCKITFYHS